MDIVEILSADYVFNTDDKYDLEGTLDAPTLRGGEIIVCDGVMYVANQNHLLLIFLFSIRIVCADGPLPQLSLFPIGVPSETSIKNIIVPLIASDIVAETTIVPTYLNKNGISNTKDTKMDIT